MKEVGNKRYLKDIYKPDGDLVNLDQSLTYFYQNENFVKRPY